MEAIVTWYSNEELLRVNNSMATIKHGVKTELTIEEDEVDHLLT